MSLPDPTVPLERPPQPSLTSRLAKLAEVGSSPAVQWRDQTWSRAELWGRVCGTVAMLRKQGLETGDPVAISGDQTPDLIAAMIAVLCSGGVLLAIDPALPLERQRIMLELARAKFFVHGEGATGLEVAQQRSVVLVPASAGVSDVAPLELEHDGPAYVFFTSGTTNTPKGVLGSRAGLHHFLAWQREAFAIGENDRCAQVTSLSFDVVLRAVLTILSSGGTLVLPDTPGDLRGSVVLPWLVASRITMIHVVPTVANAWLVATPSQFQAPDMRRTFFAGEPLHEALVRNWRSRFPRSQVINLYGPTETTLAKFFHVIGPEPDHGVQPVGSPLPQTQGLILDERGDLCHPGVVGEIVIRTAFPSRGYLDRAAEANARFTPNPFRQAPDDIVYRTGDRGRYRADGAIEILGRLDDELKIGGVRVNPQEVAAVLAACPGVRACTVQPTSVGSAVRLAAFAVCEPTVSVEQLRRFTSERLPRALVPGEFVLLSELPTSANGKVDRAALLEALERARTRERVQDGSVADGDEATVLDVFQQLLRRQDVRLDDDFIAMGGDSLLAMEAVAGIYERTSKSISLEQFLRAPSVRTVASALSSEPPLAHVEKASRESLLPITFEQATALQMIERMGRNANVQLLLRLTGALDHDALRTAIAGVVARHEALRTTFDSAARMQRVAPSCQLAIESVDVSRSDSPERAAHERAAAFAQQLFDVNTGLVHVALIQLGNADHVLSVTINHLVFDGWSRRVFLDDLATCYNAALTGSAPTWKPLAIQPADLAVMQHRREIAGEHIDFWRRQLDGLDKLRLPYINSPPASYEYELHPVGSLSHTVSEETSTRLASAARSHRATPLQFLYTAFLSVLQQYGNTSAIAANMPFAARRPELQRVIGNMMSVTVVRVDVSKTPGFVDLLGRVRSAFNDVVAHSSVSVLAAFAASVEPLRETCLRQLVTNELAIETAALPSFSGLEAAIFARASSYTTAERTMYDIAAVFSQDGPRRVFTIRYNATRFAPQSITDLLAAYAGTVDRALEGM